jgi:hypothetical protein
MSSSRKLAAFLLEKVIAPDRAYYQPPILDRNYFGS